MVYNKLKFDRHINTLQVQGFKIENAVQAYLLVRRHFTRTETITISYKDYAPHCFYVAGLSVDIFLNDVERILEPLHEQLKVKGLYNHTTIHQSLIHIEGINYKLFETEIKDDNTFSLVAGEIKKLIQKGALPFFEKYQTLKDVFEETEKMPIEQMSNFIGQPLPQRRMTIKKLCGDSGYESYAQMVIDFYKEENDPAQLQFVENLKAKLESIDPIT